MYQFYEYKGLDVKATICLFEKICEISHIFSIHFHKEDEKQQIVKKVIELNSSVLESFESITLSNEEITPNFIESLDEKFTESNFMRILPVKHEIDSLYSDFVCDQNHKKNLVVIKNVDINQKRSFLEIEKEILFSKTSINEKFEYCKKRGIPCCVELLKDDITLYARYIYSGTFIILINTSSGSKILPLKAKDPFSPCKIHGKTSEIKKLADLIVRKNFPFPVFIDKDAVMYSKKNYNYLIMRDNENNRDILHINAIDNTVKLCLNEGEYEAVISKLDRLGIDGAALFKLIKNEENYYCMRDSFSLRENYLTNINCEVEEDDDKFIDEFQKIDFDHIKF